MTNPTVFVGSSSEGKETDLKVRRFLEECDVNVESWRSSFEPGDFAVEAILEASDRCNAAVLIATSDDETNFRGNVVLSPRDNVMFELGVFLKAYGVNRTLLIQARSSNGSYPKLPSDLNGMTVVRYQEGREAALESAIREFCEKLFSYQHESTNAESIRDVIAEVSSGLERISPDWLSFANAQLIRRFVMDVERCSTGEVPLRVEDYYRLILARMAEAASGTEVMAVASLSSKMWSDDDIQQQYMSSNAAAVKRGAIIKRLFIMPRGSEDAFSNVIARQLNDGIEIRVAHPKILAGFTELTDLVIFKDPDGLVDIYKSIPSAYAVGRIRAATAVLNRETQNLIVSEFDSAFQISLPAKQIDSRHEETSYDRATNLKEAPGISLDRHINAGEKSVVSCEQAARVRGVPLANELKTLIVYTSIEPVAVHLRGDHKLSLRKVKDFLGIKEAFLADDEYLSSMKLSAGKVCAVLHPVWNMPHLISKEILLEDFVTTNDGTLTGYFKFPPELLTQALNISVGSFAK